MGACHPAGYLCGQGGWAARAVGTLGFGDRGGAGSARGYHAFGGIPLSLDDRGTGYLAAMDPEGFAEYGERVLKWGFRGAYVLFRKAALD